MHRTIYHEILEAQMQRCSTMAAGAMSVSVLVWASAAQAGFVPGQWTLGNFGDASPLTQLSVGSTVTITGPANVFGSGSLSSSLMSLTSGNAGVKGITKYEAVALTGGTVDFSWLYQSFDMPCYDNGGYFVGNVFTVIACNGSGPFAGTTSFSVTAGQKFGFAVRTGDGLEGSGTLKINGFAFSGAIVPTPGIAAGLCGFVPLMPRRGRRRPVG